MNLSIFITSIILSSIGAIADDLTTRKFTREIGIDYESSPLFRWAYERRGFMFWIVIEALVVAFFGILDSFLLDMVLPGVLLFGVFWGIYRGLLAASNFRIITLYRTIGIDTFKEHGRWLDQMLKKATAGVKHKMKLHYYVCVLACLLAYSSVLAVPFTSSYQTASFLALFSGGLILGVAVFLLKVANTS